MFTSRLIQKQWFLPATLALMGSMSAAHARQADRPNVIFFLVDDLGWKDLGCFGSDFYETPNIDRLSGQGVRFTDAYSGCQVSSPARASLLTGRYPASLQLTDWLPGRRDYPFQRLLNVPVRQELPKGEPTIAATLHENGYRTALIGKWHLSETGSKPQEYGFDLHIPDGYLKGWPVKGYYAPFGMNGFDGEPGEYLTDRITREALHYIEENRDRPFFLLLSHFAVHDPIQGRADLVEKYRKKLQRTPASELPAFILEGNPGDSAAGAESLRELTGDLSALPHKILPHRQVRIKQLQDNIQFAAMVESVDESMGKIMSKLSELGIDDRTILIFYSDNGGMSAANYGNPNREFDGRNADTAYSTSLLPFRGGKGWMYEGGIRVPLIIKWPQSPAAGTTVQTPVTSTDFYPTILSMLHIGMPAGKQCEGVDITPLLRNETLPERPVFWYVPHYSNHGMQSPSGAVREGRYKLIEYFENGAVQLFDLASDPAEQKNLADAFPDKVTRLRRKLHRWIDETQAGRLQRNPDFNPRVAFACEQEVYPAKKWELAAKFLADPFREKIDEGRKNLPARTPDATAPAPDRQAGAWIAAATLAFRKTGDQALKARLDRTAARLAASLCGRTDSTGRFHRSGLQLRRSRIQNSGNAPASGTDCLLRKNAPAFETDCLLQDTSVSGTNCLLRDTPVSGTLCGRQLQRFEPNRRSNTAAFETACRLREDLYGLSLYLTYFPDEKITAACAEACDRWLETCRQPPAGIAGKSTQPGNPTGRSLRQKQSDTPGDIRWLLFEPMALMYEHTGKKPYLDFCRQLAATEPQPGNCDYSSRNIPATAARFASFPAEKQTIILAALSGYLRFYQLTGAKPYFETVRTSWQHLYRDGAGPLSTTGNRNLPADLTGDQKKRPLSTTGNRSLQPAESTDRAAKRSGNLVHHSWLRLCFDLYDLTGQRQYLDAAEKCIMAADLAPTAPTADTHLHLEQLESRIAGELDNGVSIGLLAPAEVRLSGKFGGGRLCIGNGHPAKNETILRLDLDRQPAIFPEYPLGWRIPAGRTLEKVRINGVETPWNIDKRGFAIVRNVWNQGDEIRLSFRPAQK